MMNKDAGDDEVAQLAPASHGTLLVSLAVTLTWATAEAASPSGTREVSDGDEA